jgi:hypothetical protein
MHEALWHLEGLWVTDETVNEKWVHVERTHSQYSAWRADAEAHATRTSVAACRAS